MNEDSNPGRPALLAMKVGGFVVDAVTGQPALILTDEPGERWLPIVIGRQEASSIVLALQDAPPPRPMSHDLMKSILESTRAKVKGVVIHDLENSTYYSRVQLEADGQTFDLDARPSDGIALALRMHAPIFVTDRIPLATAQAAEGDADESSPEPAPPAIDETRFKAFLETLKPSDFLEGGASGEPTA